MPDQPLVLMAHNEDDLPFSEKVQCAVCQQPCWLGPRLSECRKAGPGPFDIWCERCTHEYAKRRAALGQSPGFVTHLGNPLS